VAAVVVKGHLDRLQAGHLRADRVAVEGWICHHDAVARVGERVQCLHDDAGSSGADDDLLVVDPQVPSNDAA